MADPEIHPDAHDHAFILKRATGEIEIRAAHPGALKREMDKHAVEHEFDVPVKHHDTLHGVTGRRKAGA